MIYCRLNMIFTNMVSWWNRIKNNFNSFVNTGIIFNSNISISTNTASNTGNGPKYIGLHMNIIEAICRDKEIEIICKELFENNKDKIVITGVGGIGKTTLSKTIAKKMRSMEKIDYVIFNSCESQEIFKKNLKDNMAAYGIDTKLELLNSFNLFYEKSKRDQKKILIIFDNVDDDQIIFDFIPPIDNTHLKIIITSQYQTWHESYFCIKLEMFDNNMSKNFILSKFRNNKPSDGVMKQLIKSCGGYPLLLTLITSYVVGVLKNKCENIDSIILNYLNNLAKNLSKNPSKHSMEPYKLSVECAISINFEKAVNDCEDIKNEEDIILRIKQIFSLCYSETLTLRRITKSIKYDTEIIKEFLRTLNRYSILNLEGNYLSIHRIIQAVFLNTVNIIDACYFYLQNKFDHFMIENINVHSLKKSICMCSEDDWNKYCKWMIISNSIDDIQYFTSKIINILNTVPKFDTYIRLLCEILYSVGNITFYIFFIQKYDRIKKIFENELKKHNSSTEDWDNEANKYKDTIRKQYAYETFCVNRCINGKSFFKYLYNNNNTNVSSPESRLTVGNQTFFFPPLNFNLSNFIALYNCSYCRNFPVILAQAIFLILSSPPSFFLKGIAG